MSQAKGVILSGKSRRTTGKCLVLCFMQFGYVANPMWYSFKSCLIENLIGHSSSIEQLKEEFVWREDASAASRCHCCVSFARVGDSLYAVGGVKMDEELAYLHEPGSLLPDLYCISLSTPLKNSHVKSKSSMNGGKYFPVAVEIDGRIYALSSPLSPIGGDTVDFSFEVYDPPADKWTPLKSLPFLRSHLSSIHGYAYVVIGNKLCISTGDMSCAYDIEHDKWEPCELFLDFQRERVTPRPRYDDFSPPFPFVGKAIVHKKDILVCNIPDLEPPIVAFRIVDGKAEEMRPLLNCMPRGEVFDIVELGGGYFSVMLFEGIMVDLREYLTFVTFKLSKTGLICGQPWKSTWRVGLGKKGRTCRPIYSFTL